MIVTRCLTRYLYESALGDLGVKARSVLLGPGLKVKKNRSVFEITGLTVLRALDKKCENVYVKNENNTTHVSEV